MDNNDLRRVVYESLLNMVSDEGINASSRTEVYGCIFGRDSAITILKILNVHKRNPSPLLLEICKRTLQTLVHLQGKEFNIESGEEPGKFIHEFRRNNYDHLLKLEKPWYVYPDKTLRNYDSIDSTALTLIAIYRYYEQTNDFDFLMPLLSSIEAGLNWIITFGDKDKDYLLEYELPELRKYGGLRVQSWTDSHESMLTPDGKMPQYPIAPVEVQSFAWLAFKLWSDVYKRLYPAFGYKLAAQARSMKKRFNEAFLYPTDKYYFAAQALDGRKNQIRTVTANPLIALWSSYISDSSKECIIDTEYINDVVHRSFEMDMFDHEAGIRTMSTNSLTYNPDVTSYHNGSFWPMLNGLIYEGLLKWTYTDQAEKLKTATIKPIQYFKTPIELYIKSPDGKLLEYKAPNGQVGCRYQAWSAAALLDILTP